MKAHVGRLREEARRMYGDDWSPLGVKGKRNDVCAIVVTPIAEEVDASQLQPEQSDETFEAVYIWDKGEIGSSQAVSATDTVLSEEKSSSQAVSSIDTGLPGGGWEIKPMIFTWIIPFLFLEPITQSLICRYRGSFNHWMIEHQIDPESYLRRTTSNAAGNLFWMLTFLGCQLATADILAVIEAICDFRIQWDHEEWDNPGCHNGKSYYTELEKYLIRRGLMKKRNYIGANDNPYPIEILPKPIVPIVVDVMSKKAEIMQLQ